MRIKILSWNVRGLNDSRKRSTIKSLLMKWRADIVCLQETKIEDWSQQLVNSLWGNRWASWAELQANGTRGGIIILWDKRFRKSVNIEPGTYSVSVILESIQEQFRWCYTGVYGPHTNNEREDLWYELASIRGTWDGQWVLGGDFNVCRFDYEKFNCHRRTRAMENFSETILDLGLMDLPLRGAQYTWSRGTGLLQASRIDRFLISSEWNDSFKTIKQVALPRVISDHKPLMLECGEWDSSSSYFKFENMWLQAEGFLDSVKNWWSSYEVEGSPDFVLVQKLKYLKKDISTWNKEVFGKLEEQRSQALNDLTNLEQSSEGRILSEAENAQMINLQTHLEQLAKIEEVSWRQKSRCL